MLYLYKVIFKHFSCSFYSVYKKVAQLCVLLVFRRFASLILCLFWFYRIIAIVDILKSCTLNQEFNSQLFFLKGPQGPQKISSLKSIKIQNDPPISGIFTFSEMAFLSNSRCQKRTKRSNRSTINGNMAETAKRSVACEGVSESMSDTPDREKLWF